MRKFEAEQELGKIVAPLLPNPNTNGKYNNITISVISCI
jgi:hypothetical protein